MVTQGAILYNPITLLMIGYVRPDDDSEIIAAMYLSNGMQQIIVSIDQINNTTDAQKQMILWLALGCIVMQLDLTAQPPSISIEGIT